jgi:hypothetical protein
VKFGTGLAIFVDAVFAEAGVGLLIVVSEIETVLDQGGAHVSVVADAISADPGVEHSEREEEEHKKKALRFARTWLWRRGQTVRLPKDDSAKGGLEAFAPRKRAGHRNREQNKSCPKERFCFTPGKTPFEIKALSLFISGLSC